MITEEHIERAFRVYMSGEDADVRSNLRACVPFLQLPWEEPTMDEANVIEKDIPRHAPPCDQLMRALTAFVRRRNAVLLPPKPIDPRIQAVKSVLEVLTDEGGRIFSEKSVNEIAERILYWIDEVK